jgi:hypothetical protein
MILTSQTSASRSRKSDHIELLNIIRPTKARKASVSGQSSTPTRSPIRAPVWHDVDGARTAGLASEAAAGLYLGESHVLGQRQLIPRDQPAMLATGTSAGHMDASETHATQV